MSRLCAACPKPISSSNKSGRCARCNLALINSDPELNLRRVEALRRKHETDPIFAARNRERCRKMVMKAWSDPHFRERRIAQGKNIHATVLSRPDVVEKMRVGVKTKSGPAITERALSWCPVEYRAEYRRLVKNRKFKAAEAKAIILAQIDAEKRRVKALSPFDKQDRALANGAQLVANDRGPTLDRPGVWSAERMG